MNKPNKCKNCQWYGKPYWSIINPCDNCPNENNVEIITIGDTKPIQEILTEEEIKKAMTNKSIFEITLEEKDKEIERLNNIINELEKGLKEEIDRLEKVTLENKNNKFEFDKLVLIRGKVMDIYEELKSLKEGK